MVVTGFFAQCYAIGSLGIQTQDFYLHYSMNQLCTGKMNGPGIEPWLTCKGHYMDYYSDSKELDELELNHESACLCRHEGEP